MSGELNDDTFRRRRPIPIPLYDDRYIERPYLKKQELAKIRDNLDELVDIKSVLVNKNVDKPMDKSIDKPIDNVMTETKKDSFFITSSDTNTIIHKPESKIPEFKVPEPKVSESKVDEIKKDELKLGISNLKFNKEIKKIDVVDDKKVVIDNKKIDVNDDKKIYNKSKINKRKVIKMNDEDQPYNISPEERRRMRKSEFEEYANEKESNEAIKKAALLAEQNKRDLEDLKRNLAAENAEIRKDLKNEFGSKFNDITGRFDKVSGKLEETCTGIECLKKDLANINKNMDLVECPECGNKVVPPLSSYCPSCSAKMYSWSNDDGTPVKGWKPNWEK